MSVLLIFNHEPYDNTDVTWNGLRLAGQLLEKEQQPRIFLMNDAVDMGRNSCVPPEGYDQDLAEILRGLAARGVPVKACGTCMARCGIYKNQPYSDGVETSTMSELADWVIDSDSVLTF